MNIKMNTEDSEAAVRVATGALSTSAIARRRVLLKGLGKGTAFLAATVPLQTLAGQSLLTFDGKHQCSVSGMHSGVHSATPSGTPLCGGYKPSWWGAATGSTPTNPWPTLPNLLNPQTPFNSFFTWMPLSGNPTLLQALSIESAQKHWLCAWLNALWSAQQFNTLNFPYSATEVLVYSGNGGAPNLDALQFFTTYLEKLGT